MKFDRVWHPIDSWEEITAGMWDAPVDKKTQLETAINFTADHKLYGHFMRRVVREWKFSCENALTDNGLNQRAWVGHAACALAHHLPESIVREAWGHLTDEQRFLANREASDAISEWKAAYAANKRLLPDMGGQML